MDVKELTHPSPAELAKVTDILSDSFWSTPLFHDFLFRGRVALSRTFIEALVIYTQKTGRIFVATDGGKGIVACSLWSLPDSPELGLKTYFTTGMLPKMLSIALHSPAAMARIAELFRFLEIYAPEFACNTLEFLASAEKGAGAALVRGCIWKASYLKTTIRFTASLALRYLNERIFMAQIMHSRLSATNAT